MPFRLPEGARASLGTRLLSALVLATVTVATAAAGGWWFAGWVLLLALVVVHEWFTAVTRGQGEWAALAALAGSWAAIAWLGSLPAALYVVVAGMAGTGMFAMLVRRTAGGLWSATAVPYAALPVVALVWMRSAEGAATVLLWMFFVIWASDSAAYVVGRLVGGPRLAPSISPRKTWSGALGGLTAAMVVGTLFASLIFSPAVQALLLAVIVSLAAQAGDLFQSFVKRRFNVKDSGSILPGHGGLMDRLDSVAFAAPVFALVWTLASVMAGLAS